MNSSLVMRCKNWVLSALGPGILFDRQERATRLMEEAMELAQCEGVTVSTAILLAERVFSRPKGEARQEMAGVYFTLLVYAWVRQFSLDDALVAELERVENPAMVEKIRAKHETKVAEGVGRPRTNTMLTIDEFRREYECEPLPLGCDICGAEPGRCMTETICRQTRESRERAARGRG